MAVATQSDAVKMAGIGALTGSGGTAGGGSGAGAAVMGANPYTAAISAIANSPPPSSAATLTTGGTYNPKTINVTGLNLGSILQPYQGSPNTGGYGYDVASPLGGVVRASSPMITDTRLKYAGISIAVAGGLFLIVKMVKR